MKTPYLFLSATDDVVKVEVWDVVDKGEYWRTCRLKKQTFYRGLPQYKKLHLFLSTAVSLLQYVMTSNRRMVACVLFCPHCWCCLFCTSLALISGQKYPLPEGVGERHNSVLKCNSPVCRGFAMLCSTHIPTPVVLRFGYPLRGYVSEFGWVFCCRQLEPERLHLVSHDVMPPVCNNVCED